jgi:hypothetical protein
MGQRTGRLPILGTLLTAGALVLHGAVAWAQGPGIILNMVTLEEGGTQVEITATLATGGSEVAGTQNDFSFEPANVSVARRPNGRPDCAVNPDIDKGGTSFAFQPAGCQGAACVRVRALVLSTDNTDPILDGSLLYTCKVDVAAAASGTFPLELSGTILSTPAGQRVCGTGASDPPCTGNVNGSITVEGGGPTGPGIALSRVTGEKGQRVAISATLSTGGSDVAGTQNDFSFDPVNIPVARRPNGRPDCAVNPDIDKGGTSFAFQPAGCTGTDCVRVRALVLSTDNTDPIPDGSELYTCNIDVAAEAPDGVYPLTLSGTILSSPAGVRVCGSGASDPPCTGNVNGSITIGGPVPPTNTPTATEAVPTSTPTSPAVEPTNTPTQPTVVVPTATATQPSGQAVLTTNITATTTSIPVSNVLIFPQQGTVQIGNELINYSGTQLVAGGPAGLLLNAQRGAFGTTAAAHNAGSLVVLAPQPSPVQDDDDGCDCRIASNGGSSRSAWMVLIPVIGLLILRRRYR